MTDPNSATLSPPSTGEKPERDASGRWAPGNRNGGRRALPDAFKDKGPALLDRMLAIAEDSSHERHFDALRWCAERIYGKAMQGHEVSSSGGLLAQLLARPAPPIPECLIPDELKGKVHP